MDDDSEPYLNHQSSTRSLILKSCDRPFGAALDRLSTCQCAAQSPFFTHTLSLNFWPRRVCHSLTKRRSLSSVTTVDVVVSPVTLSLLVLSSLFGCSYHSLAHTPDDVSQLLYIVSVRYILQRTVKASHAFLTVLSELPSQNYTPLRCNSPRHQIAKICFAAHYQPII